MVSTNAPGLILKFGGHAMAAGLTLKTEDYQTFAEAFDREARRLLTKEALQSCLITDGQLTAGELTLETAELLRNAGPWGQNFPEPLFEGVFTLKEQRLVGGKHLKLVLVAEGSEEWLDAIWFNVDTGRWPNNAVERVRVVYRLDINEFRGRRRVQLMVQYLDIV